MSCVSSVRRLSRCLVGALAVAALGACGGESLNPFQPQISTPADNFQLQATSVTDVSTTVTYAWVNSGTRASVNHSTTTTAGSTLVVIKDAAGVVVYTRTLSPSLNESTLTGQAGNWTIQLTLLRYSGTLNFRVQKL
ncbi:MAG: hypothetical protein Q8K55_11295 [Gemmatimonadaceae bacterium]|nr:hypothetical protein [Gemmatimonadaceae bacterium]